MMVRGNDWTWRSQGSTARRAMAAMVFSTAGGALLSFALAFIVPARDRSRGQGHQTALPAAVIADPTIAVSGAAVNKPPVVSAGPGQSLGLTNVARLEGVVTGDGLPNGAPLTVAWSVINGPDRVTFADAAPKTGTISSRFAPPRAIAAHKLYALGAQVLGMQRLHLPVPEGFRNHPFQPPPPVQPSIALPNALQTQTI